MDHQSGGLTRGAATWLLYVVLSCMGFLLNGLGAVLAPLQKDLRVDRAQVAFYPALFAAGLVLVGLAGGRIVDRIGRAVALRASIGGMFLGGALIAIPMHAATLVGALAMGMGGALLIQLIPTLLGAIHPHAPAAAVGEANGLASAASVIAPLAVGGTLAAGLGWRTGYLAAPLVMLVLAAVSAWRVSLPAARTTGRGPSRVARSEDDASAHERAGRAEGSERPASASHVPGNEGTTATEDTKHTAAPLLGRWFEVLLAVSVEFCMVFWAASAAADWHGAGDGLAPAVASLFLVGMAAGRSVSVPIIGRIRDGRTLVLICVVVAAGGFALFWGAPSLALSSVGLAVTGLGVSLLYPVTVSHTVAAWPHAPDRAAARAALASGLAIGGAPFVLARLADTTGLRLAYLVVPALLLALAVRTLATCG